MIRNLLKPRSYDAAKLVKEGEVVKGLLQASYATLLRTGLAYTGIMLAGFEKKDGLKAAIAGNLAITAGVFGYYMLEE